MTSMVTVPSQPVVVESIDFLIQRDAPSSYVKSNLTVAVAGGAPPNPSAGLGASSGPSRLIAQGFQEDRHDLVQHQDATDPSTTAHDCSSSIANGDSMDRSAKGMKAMSDGSREEIEDRDQDEQSQEPFPSDTVLAPRQRAASDIPGGVYVVRAA